MKYYNARNSVVLKVTNDKKTVMMKLGGASDIVKIEMVLHEASRLMTNWKEGMKTEKCKFLKMINRNSGQAKTQGEEPKVVNGGNRYGPVSLSKFLEWGPIGVFYCDENLGPSADIASRGLEKILNWFLDFDGVTA
jgi:hypothetical protein